MHRLIKIGISSGDLNGIGPEVAFKALLKGGLLDKALVTWYGSSKVASYHKNVAGLAEFPFHHMKEAGQEKPGRLNVLNCWDEEVRIKLGEPDPGTARYAALSLEKACDALEKGEIQALVTAPIHKKSLMDSGFSYPGHTQYLGHRFKGLPLMMMASEQLRIVPLTGHIPVSQVAAAINKKTILEHLAALSKCLQRDFAVALPRIAVLGLNPHAGEDGSIGGEEKDHLEPALKEARDQKIMAFGPYPADGFFGSGAYRNFDAVLAMYHDQGLIPFKTLSFGGGVNYTLNLKIIRTSPDHGTAFDLAGKQKADPSSFLNALWMAMDAVRNRAAYTIDRENPLQARSWQEVKDE